MLNYKKLHITYCDPHRHADNIIVDYRLRDTPTTKKWIERVLTAKRLGYIIDDPARFYGFGSLEQQTDYAIQKMNQVINNLNNWIKIDYRLTSVHDQDTLNKLHHIFEVEHGLLDKKSLEPEYKQALCNLNLIVHRCESLARGAYPRHVVTYFGLPKSLTLSNNDYQYFEPNVTFGTVYINYVEIGKTLYDLMMDNDSYIEPEAFQPFCHYSADFVVRFWNDNNNDLYNLLGNYYSKHHDFFRLLGYTWENLSRSIGSIPVADLDYSGDILNDLATRQFVKAVHFS